MGVLLVSVVMPRASGASITPSRQRWTRGFFRSRWLPECPLSRAMTIEKSGPRLIQRLQLDDGGVVVVAGPEGHRRRRIVDEDAPDIGLLRQQILCRLPARRIEAQHAVARHRAAP